MTPPLRDTKYAREIATARLPTGSSGSASAAIERIYVKQAAQEEIRFSLWEGNRMVDASASGLRLITESWHGSIQGSGQLHEITPAGARLLGEGFV